MTSATPSAHELAVASKRLDQLWRRLGRIQDGIEKCIAIRTGQDHALMFVKDASRALIGEVACCQSADGHRALNEFLGRSRDAQLDALLLQLACSRFRRS